MHQTSLESDSVRHRSGGNWIKLLSLMLIVGGIYGVIFAIWFVVQTLRQGNAIVPAGFGLLFIAVFVWSALKGRDLWKGRPAGYKWAKILFAVQIPLISVPGLSYWFYTGLTVWLMVQYGSSPSPGFTNVG